LAIRHEKGKKDWGFDLTEFGKPEVFKKIVKGYKLKHRTERTSYGSLTHVWESPRVKLVTEHDPLSKKVPKGYGYEPNTGFAGYMGLTGKPAAVKRLAGAIRKKAAFIKQEDEGERSYI